MDLMYYVSAILVLPAIIYSIYVSRKVHTVFNEYSQIDSDMGLYAFQVARRVLDENGLTHVQIHRTYGKLTDHYDPKTNAVYLSQSVHDSKSVGAIGVAVHECGHAIQASVGYLPYKIRMAVVPFANWGSRLAIPLILIGMLLDGSYAIIGNTTFGYILMIVGLIFYSFTTLFTFITLPVEFNASSRAKEILDPILPIDEVEGCAKVLNVAAQTYVASFAVSLLQLLRLLLLIGGRRD